MKKRNERRHRTIYFKEESDVEKFVATYKHLFIPDLWNKLCTIEDLEHYYKPYKIEVCTRILDSDWEDIVNTTHIKLIKFGSHIVNVLNDDENVKEFKRPDRKKNVKLAFIEETEAWDFANKYKDQFVPDKYGVPFRIEPIETRYFTYKYNFELIFDIRKSNWDKIIKALNLKDNFIEFREIGSNTKFLKGYFYHFPIVTEPAEIIRIRR